MRLHASLVALSGVLCVACGFIPTMIPIRNSDIGVHHARLSSDELDSIQLATTSLLAEGAEKKRQTRLVALDSAPFVVLLNQCPADSLEWDGFDDPLGTIVCGARYVVAFNSASGGWSAKGPFDPDGKRHVAERMGGDPRFREFNIWGVRFSADEKGRVRSAKGELVGRIVGQ